MCAQTVAVIGRIDDNGIVELSNLLSVGDYSANHVVKQRAVAKVARGNFLEALPSVVA